MLHGLAAAITPFLRVSNLSICYTKQQVAYSLLYDKSELLLLNQYYYFSNLTKNSLKVLISCPYVSQEDTIHEFPTKDELFAPL